MCQGFIFCLVLTRQGSNLDSSEPKSDVLPITPRVTLLLQGSKSKTIYSNRQLYVSIAIKMLVNSSINTLNRGFCR